MVLLDTGMAQQTRAAKAAARTAPRPCHVGPVPHTPDALLDEAFALFMRHSENKFNLDGHSVARTTVNMII